MEKRRQHYDLKAIQSAMSNVNFMYLTLTARHGIKRAGMSLEDAWRVIQSLSAGNFYKSMTTHADSRVWQDVYHGEHNGRLLYLKFQRHDEYFVISFKERENE